MRKIRKKPPSLTAAFRQYEEGRAYKRRIGLYETVNTNERFYRGEQWKGVETAGLPAPVFNIVRRIVSYLVSAVASCRVGIGYTDSDGSSLDALNACASTCWEKNRMDSLLRDALFDAAISGDGIFYVYWDALDRGSPPYTGDLAVKLIDNVNVFVSDVNEPSIQRQEYVIVSGRASVGALRREAISYGLREEEASLILPDGEGEVMAGDYAGEELESEAESERKATYLIKFSRNEKGCVVWEKCVRNLTLRRCETPFRLYPFASFCWERVKNRFHGAAPVSELVANQKYINKAFAMAMKHMTDTAFSKVIYDKKLIPEWSNEVGEAIGVISGGDLQNAAKTLEVGRMEEGYLDLIRLTIDSTKEAAGATDTALGEALPNNTSAIIALQEASAIPLENIKGNVRRALEDLAQVLAERFVVCYPDGRVPVGEGEKTLSQLTDGWVRARVDVSDLSRVGSSTVLSLLDRLLDGGHITLREYLDRLPAGLIPDKNTIVGKEGMSDERAGKSEDDGIGGERGEQDLRGSDGESGRTDAAEGSTDVAE